MKQTKKNFKGKLMSENLSRGKEKTSRKQFIYLNTIKKMK